MALTITIPGAVEATIGATAPAILTVGVGVPGATGPTGATGAQGPQGDPGEGVPVGGTTGQVLAKIDGTNYNTEWVNVEGDYLPLAGGTMDTGAAILIPYIGENPVADVEIRLGQTVGGGASRIQVASTSEPDSKSVLEFNAVTVQTEDGSIQMRANVIEFLGLGAPAYLDSDIIRGFAPKASPAFTGNPTAPTAALADNDTSIATTAFVQQELASGTANARNLEVYVRNQTGSTIPIGSIVYINGATGNRPTVTLAQANNDANSAQTIGFTKTAIANNGFGFVIVRGELEGLNTNSLTEGVQLYLSPTTAGTWTTTKPSAPQHLVYVGIVIRAHPTLGVILVSVQNGYELNEIHDVALASEANLDLLTYESSTDLWKNKSFATLGLLTSATASTTYAPLASPSLTGTPLSTTASVNTNTTQIATTAFVRDMLSDCTWSAPPISATTSAQSGAGAGFVSIPPDTGQLYGPNANIAGYGQKGIQMFARSNSTYGFNYTKEMRVACKMGINWQGTFTGITYTLIQRLGIGTGALAGVGFGISINMATKVLSILAHNGTTLTTKTTSWAVPYAGISSVDFMVKSDGTGTVYAYADGVLIDSTTGMSTATTSANTSMYAAVEVNSSGGTSTANALGYISNLRTFVAHG